MTTLILSLSDSAGTLDGAGGKGLSLMRLTRAGLPVPGGFILTTEAYRLFVAQNDLLPRILAALRPTNLAGPAGEGEVQDPQVSALETASRAIADAFAAGEMPREISAALAEAYAPLMDAPVAVRSSATAEDLPEASFAGQQDTYLNIQGFQAVLEAVKKCWASLWTARAIAYRARQGIAPEAVALAVVVQRLVCADAAGVMFTANPLNGKRDELMITATWGLGEAIVSGAVTPDTLTLSKKNRKILRREIAQKQVMTLRTPTGTAEAPVPAARQKQAVLDPAQAAELARLGEQIEALYAQPMDIEWALAEGKLQIVQARPITALPEPPLEWTLPNPKAVMARGSFAEFVPEPVSPLFATLAVPIARGATQELMASIGVKDKEFYVMEVLHDYVYVGMVFSGRMVWDMTLASFKMVGPMLKSSKQRAAEAREKFLKVVQKWQERELAGLSSAELLAGVREIFSQTAEFYAMAQSASIPVAMMGEAFFAAYYNLLVKRKEDPAANHFLFGAENHAMRAEKALYALAMWIKDTPSLLNELENTPAQAFIESLFAKPQPDPWKAEFAARFEDYLREYGYAIYDLDFSKPVPADAPAPLIDTLKVYLAGKNDPNERQRLAVEHSTQAVERISRRLDPLRRKYFLRLLHLAQDVTPLRENSIADLGLGHPQMRRMLREVGQRLAAGGVLANAEDIYWLEAAEVEALAAGLERGEAQADASLEIQQRKQKWHQMRKVTPPSTLPQKTWMNKFYPSNSPTGTVLKGFGASSGRVTGRACVLLGPEDFPKMQTGDILVSIITTPAWTPLFARAAGIVTDIGGPLSHSSIVAREYGIPAVLATGSGTRRIHDGQTITVDGSAGTVTLE